MAILQLKFHNLIKGEHPDMTLATVKEAATINNHDYSLVELSINKGMYRPTDIYADINISMHSGDWTDINRTEIESMFKHKRVTLNSMKEDATEVQEVIGDCFYVHEVIPEYYRDGMHLKLKIYSPDKLMTLKKTSRAFVGKRLGDDLMSAEHANYIMPYEMKGDASIQYNTDNMQQLKYKSKKSGEMVEHIFPYLVQYNESFYDMLARTANRWGEFMYFEDGKLQFGYKMPDEKSIKHITLEKDFYKITYPNQDTYDTLTAKQASGCYDCQALYDKTVDDSPVPKDPYIIRGEWLDSNGCDDIIIMKLISSFLNTEKNIPGFAFSQALDNIVSSYQNRAVNSQLNDSMNEKNFPENGRPEQYDTYNFNLYGDVMGKKDGFNKFTEISSAYNNAADAYNEERYKKTLAEERRVSKNMAVIDYDTAWPGLMIGQVIDIQGEKFIVVGVTAKTVAEDVDGAKVPKLVFRVTAIGQGTDGKFYPAELPAGHVRCSGPQTAKIADASDPTLMNRVRVVFPWQSDVLPYAEVDDADKKLGDKLSCCSPWIPFAAKGDGKSSTGRHNRGTNVVVGFIDGNIERPYVIGAVQDKVPYDAKVDIDMTTPLEHYMRMSDGSGKGLQKFAGSMLSPMFKTIASYIPSIKLSDFGNQKYLEGGFLLSDYYGIYKISGSTNDRNITISSPWGDVKMNAFTGITISAPNGDVKIKGKNVSIEAGNNLTIESGKNIGWKLGIDKRYKDYSAATLGLSLAAIVANKVAEIIEPFDLSMIRAAVEVVMRPVEGALTVKSNRFLKLEAGKNKCEYPTLAYNKERKENLLNAAADERVKKGAVNGSDGIVELINKVGPTTSTMVDKWKELYDACRNKKMTFEQTVNALQQWGNDAEAKSSNNYDDMKNVLWKDGDFDKELTENDMGFTENVKSVDAGNVSQECRARKNGTAEDIIAMRQLLKSGLIHWANDLRKAIVKLLTFEPTKESLVTAIGKFKWTVPKDAKNVLLKAFSKEACDKIISFKMYNIDDNDKKLDAEFNVADNLKKQFRRVVLLNLMEELKLDTNRAGDPLPPAKPTKENIADDAVWTAYVGSLRMMPELTLPKPGGIDFVDEFFKPTVDDFTAIFLNRPYQEMKSWNDGNNGSILIGTNDETYIVKGENENATIGKIESFAPHYLEATDVEDDVVKKFFDRIKETLNNN